MKKIYSFSETIKTDFITKLPFFSENFELVPFQGLSAEESLKREFDIILLSEGDFNLFKPVLHGVSWKTNQTGVADTIVKSQGGYRPLNLNADCILQILRSLKVGLDTSHSAMVVGSYDFVLSVTAKIALSGYSQIIFSLSDHTRVEEFQKKIKEFIFNLNLQPIHLNELTRLQTTSGLLISNVTQEMDQEAFEAITYFNFLNHGALFVDFQAHENPTLVEEAKKAELQVVEGLEILTLKFKSLI